MCSCTVLLLWECVRRLPCKQAAALQAEECPSAQRGASTCFLQGTWQTAERLAATCGQLKLAQKDVDHKTAHMLALEQSREGCAELSAAKAQAAQGGAEGDGEAAGCRTLKPTMLYPTVQAAQGGAEGDGEAAGGGRRLQARAAAAEAVGHGVGPGPGAGPRQGGRVRPGRWLPPASCSLSASEPKCGWRCTLTLVLAHIPTHNLSCKSSA